LIPGRKKEQRWESKAFRHEFPFNGSSRSGFHSSLRRSWRWRHSAASRFTHSI